MSLYLDWITVDSHDPRRLAEFWSKALGYRIYEDEDEDDENEVSIVPDPPQGARITFYRVADAKTVKNRLHFDLRPPGDQAAEVARLKELGATEVDIGQGDDVTWTVLADPEGNEFCVLRTLTPDEEAKRKEAGWS